jgi:hypothetical protein
VQVSVGNGLRLERREGGFYWLDMGGAELRQGATLFDAEPLQSSFVAAMKSVAMRSPRR